jgi:hypothetical protein
MRMFRMETSLSIAPVDPDPQKITACSSVPPTASQMIARASSRKRVVCRPVPEVSVWVFAYRGRTASCTNSSMNVRARPDAV